MSSLCGHCSQSRSLVCTTKIFCTFCFNDGVFSTLPSVVLGGNRTSLSVARVAQVSLGDFRRGWEQMGTKAEVLEKFALGFKKLDEAVAAVEDFLGMQTCDGTGR